MTKATTTAMAALRPVEPGFAIRGPAAALPIIGVERRACGLFHFV
jgi:hypothetical protein